MVCSTAGEIPTPPTNPMNFKTAFTGTAVALITAASTLSICPVAQAADGCGRGWHWSVRQQACIISRHQRLVCPRGYRPTRRGPVRCVRNNSAPRPGYRNVYNVTNVSYGSGYFEQRRGSRWVERNSNGKYRFHETHRDGGTIYLHDSQRHLKVELDLARGKVVLDEAFQRRDLYSITQVY